MSWKIKYTFVSKALYGSKTLSLVFFGKTYCHCAVPTGEHSRKIDVRVSQASSERGEPSETFSKARRSESRWIKISRGKHFLMRTGYAVSSPPSFFACSKMPSAYSLNKLGLSLQQSFARATRATRG